MYVMLHVHMYVYNLLPCVHQCIANVFSADNATVADLIGLTFWKYIEERRGPPVFVRTMYMCI